MSYQKRFPADTGLNEFTFLNDKNIDGELYAFLQEISKGKKMNENQHKTIVYKEDIPIQSKICQSVGIKSPKTLRTHMSYLIEKGYVTECEEGYELPEMENIFFMIPLETLKYLNRNCREHVIKIYIYLGQRYKYAISRGEMYNFTLEELGRHIGIKIKNSSKGYEDVNYALELLYNSGLIKYKTYFDGVSHRKRLIEFNLEYRKVND